MPKTTPDSETLVVLDPETKRETKVPKNWKVWLHNDDYTHMDFVVNILRTVFRKSTEESVRLMLAVHHQGKAMVGVYTKEVAETKVNQVEILARENGFPLKASAEEE